MRKGFLMRCGAGVAAAIIALTPVDASAATLLKLGSRGYEVKTIQTELKDLGYFTYSNVTGYYGSITKDAVKRFQRANGLYADGIIGKKTFGTLNSMINKYKSTPVKKVSALSGSAISLDSDKSNKIVGSFDWFTKVRNLWDRGETAVVTDIDTGLSFTVKRTYGTNHADVEPLTKNDTETIKDIWGGFSWERRAVTVEIGNYIIAGSMTAMPHAGVDSVSANRYVRNRSAGYGYGVNLDAVKNNGCSGVMDIHFKNSRTHSTNVVQRVQQDMVKKAAVYLGNL
jgi:peptidoglycan hydrolase-like protein with peptidoglycan-binding domain